MKLETKYDNGDIAWYIVKEHHSERYRECELCEATGRVKIVVSDTLTADCPNCFGRGDYYHPVVIGAQAVPRTIGQVRVLSESKTNRGKKVVEYMCRETGIGSGQIYKEADLYSTLEEANAKIEGMKNEEDA